MLNVTQEQIRAYNGDSVSKKLVLKINEFEIPSSQIHQESMMLKESLCSGKNLEFVGCISSEFRINIENSVMNCKGQKIEVGIVHLRDGETRYKDEDIISLFNGIVDSAKMQGGKPTREIVAYDELYTKGQVDVSKWYNNILFNAVDSEGKPAPVTLKRVRETLLDYLEIPYDYDTVLPNDSMMIDKIYEPKLLKGLSVLKAICQINGCFGIINRSGIFEFRFVEQGQMSDRTISNEFPFYKQIIHQEFYVKPFERVQIRESEKDEGVTVGDGSLYSNKYIIQANMFTYKKNKTDLIPIAENIYNKVKNITFFPVDTDNNGLPFVEVGDTVQYDYHTSAPSTQESVYTNDDEEVFVTEETGLSFLSSVIPNSDKFIVLNRELKGIQALRDSYGADGEEEASEYITDLQTQIDTIKQSGGSGDFDPKDYYTKEETGAFVDERIAEEGFMCESVTVLPAQRKAGTLYLVRGDITII